MDSRMENELTEADNRDLFVLTEDDQAALQDFGAQLLWEYNYVE
ncbi:hypothetical protein [Sulfobacillus sp. hq2]|nr:hypothetical protein [Sulfobacillus sp. hq2]